MAISIRATRDEHSITVWLTGLNPEYNFDDRYLEYFICETGTNAWESDGTLYQIKRGITTTPKHKFYNLESSTEYDIKIIIGFLGDTSPDQEYTLTKWTADPKPILQKFNCFSDINADDDWLRASCHFSLDNISEGNTEYSISARQSGTEYWYPKEEDNIYKYSVTESGDSARGTIIVRLNSVSESEESRMFDFRLTVKTGALETHFFVYDVEIMYNPIDYLEVKQGSRNSDGTYFVKVCCYLKKEGFYSFNMSFINNNTGQGFTHDRETDYAIGDAIPFWDDLPIGNYTITVNVNAYNSKEDYENDIWNTTATGYKNTYIDVVGPAVDYFEWDTEITPTRLMANCINKEIHPVTATEWKRFISRITELKDFLMRHNMSFIGFPDSFTKVIPGMNFSPAIYNEVAYALKILSYAAGEKYSIMQIDDDTVLTASLFSNLRDQFNFLVDNI